MSLEGKTLFISGGSRGIGLAIAIRAARDGANVALIAKTAQPSPKLDGTVYTTAGKHGAARGHALPIVGDIRDEAQVVSAVAAAAERFGGIDVCVNNASAINLGGTEALEIRRYDLMQSINTRGTFVVSRACVPHLKRSANPHILTLSPPVSLEPRWLGPHVGYTIAKYGMTLCALGFAAEFAEDGIASNALWPRTLIATAAVQNLLGGEQAMARARRPELQLGPRHGAGHGRHEIVADEQPDGPGQAGQCPDADRALDDVGGADRRPGQFFRGRPPPGDHERGPLPPGGRLGAAERLFQRGGVDLDRARDRAASVGGAGFDAVVLVFVVQPGQQRRSFGLAGHLPAQHDPLPRRPSRTFQDSSICSSSRGNSTGGTSFAA